MRRWIALLGLLLFVPLGFATFPYNVPWLTYADKRLIYEVNTVGLTNQDVYVVVDIDPAILQSYVDRWAEYCDPRGKYDWFWPTFTYASTYNQTERMVQVVEFNNTQTFTVGSCGTVEIPTRYVLSIGTLDGGASFASYQHFVYAYLKYPYSDDFSDNVVGAGEYDGTINLGFSATFELGNYIYSTGWVSREVNLDTNLDSIGDPLLLCVKASGDPVLSPYALDIDVNGNTYRVFSTQSGCKNVEDVLRGNGFSGTVTITSVRVYTSGSKVYWWWLIPEDTYKKIQYG